MQIYQYNIWFVTICWQTVLFLVECGVKLFVNISFSVEIQNSEKKMSEYDHEIPQSHTAYQAIVPAERATTH